MATTSADRIAEYLINLGASGDDLRASMARVKSGFRADVAELEAISSKVELFKGAEARAAVAQDAFFKARDAAASYRQEIARIEAQGGKVSDELVRSLQAAEKAAASASREYNRQADQVAKLSSSLKKAGVDTSNLAAEQIRLANASRQAAAAAAEADARQVLGLKTLKDITPEINRINAAYATLRSSGTLSVRELALAQQQLQTRTAALRNSLTGVADATKGADLVGFFQRPLVHAIGLTGGITGVVLALVSAIGKAHEFEDGLARIGAITNASKGELAGLGEEARAVATELGVGITDSLRALFDLIRSGVPRENAIEALRLAAEAAKANFTDLGTGVKATNLLLDSFGADLSDLPDLFDKLTAASKNGGATLKEFAENAGPLLTVARSAGFAFDDVIATLTVLVAKSGNAEKSFADLAKIIAKLDTSEARAKLNGLNVTSTDLVGIFRQLGAQGKTVGQVLGIDLTGAGTKSAASIAALTSNAGELPEKLDAIGNSAGEVKKTTDGLFDTPTERSARFSAAVENAQVSLGDLARASGGFVQVGTLLANTVASLAKGFQESAIASFVLTGPLGLIARLFGDSKKAADASTAALDENAAAQKRDADAAKDTAVQISKANKALTDFGADLSKQIPALQQALARDIADINARADAQIAALDRARDHEAETAASTLQIQLDAAAKRLEVIQRTERAVTDAVDAQVLAREKLERDEGKSENDIAAASANDRIKALAPVLAAYQAHYAALIQTAQAAAAKFQVAEQARVAIAKAVNDQLREIALEGLSGLDQFVERQKQVDELISQGRRKAIEGDIAASKEFFDQAIAESNKLTTVVNSDGVVVVTALQARTAKLDALKKVSDAANESIGGQGEAAKKGSETAIAEAEKVRAKIEDLQGQYDALKATAAEGLQIRVDLDQESVRTAFDTIGLLTQPRVLPIVVQVVGGGPGGGQGPIEVPAPIIPGLPLNRGGYVRKFAGGGSVFRAPTWSKVPGVGNEDTVPALLKAGSFVVRKSASQRAGDDVMSAISRFAVGGIAGNILAPDPGLLSRILGLGSTGDTVAAAGPYMDTLAKLTTILEASRALPKGSPGHAFGTPIQDWAGTILAKWQIFSEDRRKAIDTAIQADFAGLMSSIQEGLRQHVEVNVAFELAALALRRGSRGAAGDTVPALLTPGEWVISPPAVQRLGSTFLNALNLGKIAPAALGGFMTPPVPRFAAGGPVPGASIPRRPSSAARGGDVVVNVYGAPSDFKDASSVRRLLLPTIREIQRRSAKG